MSLHLMRERINHSGKNPREEMIRDGQNLLKEELEHDSSYSPTCYFYDPIKKVDDRPAKLRIYNREYSSLNGNYESFLTTYDNPVRIGEYIHDIKDDTYWIVYNSFNVNDIHYEGKLIQCNYLLKWQLSDGKVVERWANIVSASKYDVGESYNGVIRLSSNNYTILIGYCEEGFELESKRVFIDIKPVNPTKVFKLTRMDDVLYNSGNIGSILSFIADKTELNPETDRPDLRLCDYIKPHHPHLIKPHLLNEINNLFAHISGPLDLKLGFSRTYIVTFKTPDGSDIDWNTIDYRWNIVSDFSDKFSYNETDNQLELLIKEESLIESSFTLQIIVSEKILAQKNIRIVEGW